MNGAGKPFGVALIGAGLVGKTHVEALSDARDVAALKAIVSRSPERAAHLAAHYAGPSPRFTSDLAAVAADPEIQVAIVATPPSVREAVIAPLVQAGKHILLEKPVARTTQEAEAVVALCARAGVRLGVVFQHRMRAPSIAAARRIARGDLGRLGLVEINVPLWRDQSYYDELGRGTYARDGGGVMMTNAIHSINLALSLAGPVTRVQAMTATTPLHQLEAEDFAIAGLTFACGASGAFVASTAMYPHRTEVIRLHYERASLRLDKNSLTIDWRDGGREVEGQGGDRGPVVPLAGGKKDWHRAVIEDFLGALRDGGEPLVTGAEALVSHRLIEAIETSSRTGAAVQIAAQR